MPIEPDWMYTDDEDISEASIDVVDTLGWTPEQFEVPRASRIQESRVDAVYFH